MLTYSERRQKYYGAVSSDSNWKHPLLVKTPSCSLESREMLSQKFSILPPHKAFLFWRATVLQLEVGEFPKGGPWGQFNETMANIASEE